MSASKNSFLDHVKWFRKAVADAGGEASIALDSWQAVVRDGPRQVAFYPRFQAVIGGRVQYEPALTDAATMFVGWLPYRFKRWDTAMDKLALKRYAGSVGLRVPQAWMQAAPEATDVVVKRPKSLSGSQVGGPYRHAADRKLDDMQAEYYERFVEGRILKAWFWNDEAVCAELDTMPAVWGDGVSTLGELVLRRSSQFRAPGDAERQRVLQRCAVLFAYHGRKITDVLKKSERQVIDFRYGSALMHASERQVLPLREHPDLPWIAQVRDAGRKLFDAIPAQIRSGTLFTLDAVLSPLGEVFVLEANCNPAVHPLTYPTMAAALLGANTSTALTAVH